MQYSPTPSAFEQLEKRTLMSVINVNDKGARPNDGGDDFNAIQAAINAAQPGDTVKFAAGTYNINGQLLIRTGRELAGAGVGSNGTTLQFSSPPDKFAAIIQQDASNVSIHHFNMRANSGIFAANGFQRNLRITQNDFVWGSNGSNYTKHVLRGGGGSDGLVLENNYFHDSLSADRAFDLWGPGNASISNNKFFRISDGGHIMDPRDNVRYVGNVGEQIHRFGLELQDEGGSRANNLLIADNVFTNWYQPYPDSFGMSIMPQRSTNVKITNNYMSSKDMTGGWGPGENGNGLKRYGLGFEAGFTSGEVSGNTIIGTWAAFVTAAMPNTPVKDNKFYGRPVWTYVMGQPGLGGHGNAIESNNLKDGDANHAPSAPQRNAGPTGGAPSPTPTPTPTPNPTPAPIPSGSTSYLSDMAWVSASNAWGTVERNKSNGERGSTDGNQIRVAGKAYDKGLGVHADSTIVYKLDKKFSTFNSDIGIDDEVNSAGSVEFEVWGDGVKLFDSGLVRGSDALKSFQLDVRNITELKLVTTGAGDGISYDHADWANARVS